MDVKQEKLKLIRWLSDQNDPDIIQAFVALKESSEKD